MNYNYFYKLGHQPQLAAQEYKFLLRDSDFIHNDEYLLSNQELDVQLTGSLVYGGQILKTWNKEINLLSGEELCRFIKQYLEAQPVKKLGVVIPEIYRSRILSSTKSAGAKKVNLISMDTPLNYGHWKQTKNWLIFFSFEGKTILGRLSHYSDQEFWQNLDTKLPKGEMSRGLINLKLARTLLNLTDKKVIWDPFCGFGRIFTAGLDLKDNFYGSDVDAGLLSPDIQANYDFAKDYWQKYGFKQRQTSKTPNLAELKQVCELDARFLSVAKFADSPDFRNVVVVTEGFLGKNFKLPPTKQEIELESENLKDLWSKTLQQAQALNIPDLIICLPFYQIKGEQLLPYFIGKIIAQSGYRTVDFDGQDYLLYSRKSSYVGHYILKLQLL